jgi:hypothetical protein
MGHVVRLRTAGMEDIQVWPVVCDT